MYTANVNFDTLFTLENNKSFVWCVLWDQKEGKTESLILSVTLIYMMSKMESSEEGLKICKRIIFSPV